MPPVSLTNTLTPTHKTFCFVFFFQIIFKIASNTLEHLLKISMQSYSGHQWRRKEAILDLVEHPDSIIRISTAKILEYLDFVCAK